MNKMTFLLSGLIILFYGCVSTKEPIIIPGQDLQTLIDSLPSGTNEVQLDKCIYSLSAPISLPSGIKIVGQGAKTILRAEAWTSFPLITNKDWEKGNSEIVIESLTLDGFGSKHVNLDENTYSRIGKGKISKLGNTGIFFRKVNGAILKNIYCNDFKKEGILLTDCSGIKLLRNIFHNCAQKYAKRYLSSGSVFLHHSDDCLISENSFMNCFEGGIFLGINCNRNIIAYNKCEQLPGGPGILIDQGNDNLVSNNFFLKNNLFSDRYNGVIVISGIPQKTTEKKSASRNIILSNIIQSAGYSGISIIIADETRIIRNVIKKAGESLNKSNAAIIVNNSRKTLIQNNLIQENQCPGISVIKSKDVHLIFNSILDNKGKSLVVDRKSIGVAEKLNTTEAE